MKAILTIDMPTSCIDCPFTLAHICDGGKQTISEIKGRHESCPLKPMPEEKEVDYSKAFDYADGYFAEGWNACLEEIEK